MIVFDASAVIALSKKEPGWERVAKEVSSSAISTVNLAESLSKFLDDGGDPSALAAEVINSGCEVVPVSFEQALSSAKLRAATRWLGLSLGDRICLALAIERQCAVLTADRNWAKLNIGVTVQLIR